MDKVVGGDRPRAVGERVAGAVRDTSRRIKCRLTWGQVSKLDGLLSEAFEQAATVEDAEEWVEIERTILRAWVDAGERPGLLEAIDTGLTGRWKVRGGHAVAIPDGLTAKEVAALDPSKPNLGPATTRELLNELLLRFLPAKRPASVSRVGDLLNLLPPEALDSVRTDTDWQVDAR